MAIQLLSNVKIITSGTAPTTENLLVGQAAFGKITSDGRYHLYGNSDGTVVDIVLSSVESVASMTLDDVLSHGNTSSLTIQLDDTSGNVTVLAPNSISITNGTRKLEVNSSKGFTDAGKPVLSANPNNTVSTEDSQTMRNILSVYSKSEIDTKISGVYVYKGTISSFSALIAKEEYTPVVGDVWNIETAGGTDKNGTAIKAGDNVAFVGPKKATDWDVLSGIVDLSGYYTKTDIDGKVDTLNQSISEAANAAAAADSKAEAAQSDVDSLETRVETIEGAGYQTASDVNTILTEGHYVSDANYVHTDNNYTTADKDKVAKIVTNGDGTKVLTDDGTYQQLELSVVSI